VARSLKVTVRNQHRECGLFRVIQTLRALTHDADLPDGDCGAEQDEPAHQHKRMPEQLAYAVADIDGFGRAPIRARIQSLMTPQNVSQ
jgi:hypothetical protein